MISECSASFNTGNGIYASGSHIVGNTCRGNGFSGDGAGILVIFDESRIEGNNCTNNDRGIDVDGAGNIIIRNTCSGNTVNWDIVAGNSYLIVQAATTASNFTGDAGGGGVGSTNPHANFTF
jgi:parallel beta-helix repeat protein